MIFKLIYMVFLGFFCIYFNQVYAQNGSFEQGGTTQENIHNVITPHQVHDEQNISKILTGKDESLVQLARAKIVYADYVLLKRDFPVLAALTNSEIDDWILEQAGYISIPQTKQTEVNNSIPITSNHKVGHRPGDYGRGIIFKAFDPKNPTKQIGFFDVKGAGAIEPKQESHKNGLMALGECFTDLIHELTVREALADSGVEFKNVGTYAVIDSGFSIKHRDNSQSPAGLLIRQFHSREIRPIKLTESKEYLDLIYKKYGISVEENFQGIGAQGIWDFGHYVYESESTVKWGPQIESGLAVPWDQYGYDLETVDNHPTKDDWYKSKLHRPWVYSNDTAKYAVQVNGPQAKKAVANLLTAIVGTFKSKLKKNKATNLNNIKNRFLKRLEESSNQQTHYDPLEYLFDLVYIHQHVMLSPTEASTLIENNILFDLAKDIPEIILLLKNGSLLKHPDTVRYFEKYWDQIDFDSAKKSIEYQFLILSITIPEAIYSKKNIDPLISYLDNQSKFNSSSLTKYLKNPNPGHVEAMKSLFLNCMRSIDCKHIDLFISILIESLANHELKWISSVLFDANLQTNFFSEYKNTKSVPIKMLMEKIFKKFDLPYIMPNNFKYKLASDSFDFVAYQKVWFHIADNFLNPKNIDIDNLIESIIANLNRPHFSAWPNRRYEQYQVRNYLAPVLFNIIKNENLDNKLHVKAARGMILCLKKGVSLPQNELVILYNVLGAELIETFFSSLETSHLRSSRTALAQDPYSPEIHELYYLIRNLILNNQLKPHHRLMLTQKYRTLKASNIQSTGQRMELKTLEKLLIEVKDRLTLSEKNLLKTSQFFCSDLF